MDFQFGTAAPGSWKNSSRTGCGVPEPRGRWLATPWVRALPLAHPLEPGSLLVAGRSRTKLGVGAASREPQAQCRIPCVSVAASLCVCVACAFVFPGNEGFRGWVPGRSVGVSPRLGVRSESPEAREMRENRRGIQQATEGVPGAALVLVSVVPARRDWGLRHQRCAPLPSGASPKGSVQRRWRHWEVRRDPWPPRCGLWREDSTDGGANVFSSRRSVALVLGWVTFLQKMKGALLSSATVV